MWVLKNSFLVSMSTMHLNFDRKKTHPETVLHTLLVCESSEVHCLWLYLKDSFLTLDKFSRRLERDRAVMVTTGVSVW